MPALTDRERRFVGGAWAFRAQLERNAVARFERLATELSAVGARPAVAEMARKAAADERRHVVICSAMASHYGVADRPSPIEARPIGPRDLALADRVLYELVAFCCLTETINAALMTATLRAVRDPRARQAVREILRDEVNHSRLGWAHLASETPRAASMGLGAHLPRMLAGTVREELFAPESPEPNEAQLVGHGELRRAARQVIFETVLHEVVFLGLERFGVETKAGRRWLAARQKGRT